MLYRLFDMHGIGGGGDREMIILLIFSPQKCDMGLPGDTGAIPPRSSNSFAEF